MRRLRNNRSPDSDELTLEGFDRLDLEGDAIGPAAEEIPWLRPFGADLPGPVLADSPSDPAETEGTKTLRQARALLELGRRLDAMLLLRRSIGEDPRGADPSARMLLAELLDQVGEPEAAIGELSEALGQLAETYSALVQRGNLLARMGRLPEAERDLRAAVRQRPKDPRGHHQLGMTLLRRGLGAEAARSLEAALQAAPNDPELLYQLGEARQSTGDLDGALAVLQRAAGQAPRDPRPLKLMGRLLDRLGRTEEAMAMHRRARQASLT